MERFIIQHAVAVLQDGTVKVGKCLAYKPAEENKEDHRKESIDNVVRVKKTA